MRERYYLALKIRPPPSPPNFLFNRRREKKCQLNRISRLAAEILISQLTAKKNNSA